MMDGYVGAWIIAIVLIYWITPAIKELTVELTRIANAMEDYVYEDDEDETNPVGHST